MALLSLGWQKTGPRNHIISFEDELGGSKTIRVEVPEVLPEGYTTNAEYVYDYVKGQILIARRRAIRRQARIDAELQWADPTDENQTVVDNALAQLQADLDA